MLEDQDYPKSIQFEVQTGQFRPLLDHTVRRLQDMAGMFADQVAVKRELERGGRVIYEFDSHPFKTSHSDMVLGVTRINPGKVGDEFFMTKGHIHERDDQPEIYHCVQGEGYLLLQTMGGEFQAERWTPGTISHIPPMWAHRVVNTGDRLLIFLAVFHLSAGHDYRPIEEKGFRKRVIERNGQVIFIPDNRWT
jgi:glucose-6-phosphate isomerase